MELKDNSSIKTWEELRRQAREFGEELDTKLFNLSKIQSSRSETRITFKSNGFENYEAEPLIDSKDSFDHLSGEIENLLTSLQNVNAEMSQACHQMTNSNAVLYILQRHQEILKDYRNEFNKTRSNIEDKLNRAKLFKGNTDSNDYGYTTNKKTDHLMKEGDHLRSSEIMIDDQIQIAMRTRETLRNQRTKMKTIQTQLTTLANTFPMVTNVMQKIGVKKKKDAIIIAIVIAVCLFLLLMYVFF